MDLIQRFKVNWQRLNPHPLQQPFLVAVSGGRDSMALAALMQHAGIPIVLAHCNFQLRSESSELDQQLVSGWANSKNIPFYCIRFNTLKVMEEQKKGVQETARMLRYEWFDTLCKENDYAGIATAHHADDNAETLLINLCKGTGIAGLHGIPEKNGNIIRPLLFATRKEIDDCIQELRVPFREDESNSSVKYLRNAVRHTIMPVLNEVFPGVVSRLNENIHRFKETEAIYRQSIDQKKKKLIERRGKDYYVSVLKLEKEEAIDTICFELFSPFGFTIAQLPEIRKLCKSESGHYISSDTHRLIKNRAFLIITEQQSTRTDMILVESLPALISTSEGTFRFSNGKHDIPEAENKDLARIDMDRLSFPLVLRRRKTGDYFYPLGMGMKKKKLSRFLIDCKVPIHEKENIWVVEHKKQIVWVTGMRLDERFKLQPATKNILEIRFSKK